MVDVCVIGACSCTVFGGSVLILFWVWRGLGFRELSGNFVDGGKGASGMVKGGSLERFPLLDIV